MEPNKFSEICSNVFALNNIVGQLEEAQVQQCLTSAICSSCNKYTADETMGSEPIINI